MWMGWMHDPLFCIKPTIIFFSHKDLSIALSPRLAGHQQSKYSHSFPSNPPQNHFCPKSEKEREVWNISFMTLEPLFSDKNCIHSRLFFSRNKNTHEWSSTRVEKKDCTTSTTQTSTTPWAKKDIHHTRHPPHQTFRRSSPQTFIPWDIHHLPKNSDYHLLKRSVPVLIQVQTCIMRTLFPCFSHVWWCKQTERASQKLVASHYSICICVWCFKHKDRANHKLLPSH